VTTRDPDDPQSDQRLTGGSPRGDALGTAFHAQQLGNHGGIHHRLAEDGDMTRWDVAPRRASMKACRIDLSLRLPLLRLG
jgi:hypothetical protein